jgi:hypothetical protein
VRHLLLLFCEAFSSAATLWLHFPFLSHLKKCRKDATMARVIKTPKRAASNCVSILYMCVCDTTRHIR